jgi:hypothetical protein
MPRKTPSTKLVLWDELHVSLYGPSNIRNNSVARRSVENLMGGFGQAVKECMKDRAWQSSILKRFRIKVQS